MTVTGDTREARRAPAPADASLGRAMFGLGLRVPLDDRVEFEIDEAADVAALVPLVGRARAAAIAPVDLDLPPADGAAAVTSVRDSATRFREEVKAGVSGACSFEPEES